MSAKNKTKTVKKKTPPTKKVEKVEEPQRPAPIPLDQLTEEQYMKLMSELDIFQESFCAHLAGTAQYEIIARVDEKGRFILKTVEKP